MDLSWILDRLLDGARITAGHEERITTGERAIADHETRLDGLESGISGLTDAEDYRKEARTQAPARNQAIVGYVIAATSVIAIVLSVIALFRH